MTVLLIDGVGRRQVREIPRLVCAIDIALYDQARIEPSPVPDGFARLRCRVARFELEDAPSWPPVYRWAGVHEL